VSTVFIEDRDPLTIRLSGGLAARLFGLPFLLVGGYLGFHLAGGVLDLLTGRASLSEMLAGTVLLLVVTAAFLVPGWLLVASRARIEINRMRGTVSYVRDLRIYEHREQRPLSEFTRIEVDLLSVRPNQQPRGRSYRVELAGATKGKVTAGLFDAREDAIAFAQRLGALIGLPAEDVSERERA